MFVYRRIVLKQIICPVKTANFPKSQYFQTVILFLQECGYEKTKINFSPKRN